MSLKENRRCCYVNTLPDFMEETIYSWIDHMKTRFPEVIDLPLGDSQVHAWEDCFYVLQDQLPHIAEKCPAFHIVFEYVLPYESGRRPDVLLVSKEEVIIIEFKQNFRVVNADVDQVAAYARDIHEYHYESRGMEIEPLLVLTATNSLMIDTDVVSGVLICTKDELTNAIESKLCPYVTGIEIEEWLNSKYEPLPTIVEAAKLFVKREELPNIRRVNSTCIPQAIDCLKDISKYAEENKKHVVAFVTGVPGAGKTFLGLKYVYDICEDYENVNSVYLSGNGPLVAVLADALHSGVFVKDLHKIIKQYLMNGAPDFHNNIIVFDEGQRAWDRTQMQKKRNTTKSEPDVMIELCEKRLEWCVLLVLVGEGQEIYNGENSGIEQWNDAIERSEIPWEIICPDKIKDVFPGKDVIQHENRDALNLSTSLRTHLAGNVSSFANALVAGDIQKAKNLAPSIIAQGFNIYVTRDLIHAKNYLLDRYYGETTKRYGMIASSKGNILRNCGMDNSFQGALGLFKVGKWFNAPVDDPRSCCALDKVATEFSCQGLELDMPLIGWDSDMLWEDGHWQKFKPGEPDDSDANIYRRNSYRVLLTRGRDGFIIFVPQDKRMDGVYNILLEAGIEPVESNGLR